MVQVRLLWALVNQHSLLFAAWDIKGVQDTALNLWDSVRKTWPNITLPWPLLPERPPPPASPPADPTPAEAEFGAPEPEFDPPAPECEPAYQDVEMTDVPRSQGGGRGPVGGSQPPGANPGAEQPPAIAPRAGDAPAAPQRIWDVHAINLEEYDDNTIYNKTYKPAVMGDLPMCPPKGSSEITAQVAKVWLIDVTNFLQTHKIVLTSTLFGQMVHHTGFKSHLYDTMSTTPRPSEMLGAFRTRFLSQVRPASEVIRDRIHLGRIKMGTGRDAFEKYEAEFKAAIRTCTDMAESDIIRFFRKGLAPHFHTATEMDSTGRPFTDFQALLTYVQGLDRVYAAALAAERNAQQHSQQNNFKRKHGNIHANAAFPLHPAAPTFKRRAQQSSGGFFNNQQQQHRSSGNPAPNFGQQRGQQQQQGGGRNFNGPPASQAPAGNFNGQAGGQRGQQQQRRVSFSSDRSDVRPFKQQRGGGPGASGPSFNAASVPSGQQQQPRSTYVEYLGMELSPVQLKNLLDRHGHFCFKCGPERGKGHSQRDCPHQQ